MKGIKISTLTDENGQPLSMVVSPANVHDSRLYQPTMDGFRIKIAQGRPISRPTIIVADAAHDQMKPKKFDQEVYKKRSAVERFFSRIEGFRKIFPQYEVLEESYLGLARLSCILIIWIVLR